MTRSEARAARLGTYIGKPCKRGHRGVRYLTGRCVECRTPGTTLTCLQVRSTAFYLEQQAAAKLAGASTYEGRPCRRAGHTERSTTTGACVMCGRLKIQARQKADPEWANARNKRSRLRNPETTRLRGQRWARENREKHRAKGARRRASQLQATPAWVDHAAILPFYEEAVRVSRETGIQHEVDHIVPLVGKTVCGLHVPWNLQVLTMTENRSKGHDHCVIGGRWYERQADEG